ncbi:MAG: hypothetical protein CM15mP2_4350 [Methanobacteriota archaeon]|nr:MAG: hypothetical protein CM15mP2_4350 [Euryarchaeota archaeon]
MKAALHQISKEEGLSMVEPLKALVIPLKRWALR